LATVNIGNLTFTHRGDYASGTAYVKNDVVYYATNGNAYIAKQATTGNAPTNGTYWSQFAAGSGGIWNAGLSLGSAGQVVKVNSGASALEFGTVSSDFVKIASGNHSGTALVIDNCFTADYTHYKFYLYNACMNGDSSYLRFQLRSGGSSGTTSSASEYRFRTKMNYRNSSSAADTGEHAWNDSSFRIGWNGSPNSAKAQHVEMYLDDPYSNTIKFMASGIHGHLRDDDVAVATFAATNDTTQTTRWTGLRWYVNSGNSWTAKYAVYGMKV